MPSRAPAFALSGSRDWPGGPCPMLLTPRLSYEREYPRHRPVSGRTRVRAVPDRGVPRLGGFPDAGVASDYLFWIQRVRDESTCCSFPAISSITACTPNQEYANSDNTVRVREGASRRLEDVELFPSARWIRPCSTGPSRISCGRRPATRTGSSSGGRFGAAAAIVRFLGLDVADWIRYLRPPESEPERRHACRIVKIVHLARLVLSRQRRRNRGVRRGPLPAAAGGRTRGARRGARFARRCRTALRARRRSGLSLRHCPRSRRATKRIIASPCPAPRRCTPGWRRERPDVLHVHSMTTGVGLPEFRAAERLRIRVIVDLPSAGSRLHVPHRRADAVGPFPVRRDRHSRQVRVVQPDPARDAGARGASRRRRSGPAQRAVARAFPDASARPSA